MPLPSFGNKYFRFRNDTEGSPSPNTSASGSFICPQCMTQLSSAKELQDHFDTLHGNDDTELGDQISIKFELTNLRSSLKEERDYSTELKKQIESLQSKLLQASTVTLPPNIDQEKSLVEVAYYMQQIQMLEAGKSLVTSQMMETEKQLSDLEHQFDTTKRENAQILEKSAQISKTHADLSAQLDESMTKTAALEEHTFELRNRIVELEEQLCARPTEDDTVVLRQELIHAQTLMNQMTCDRENDAAKLKVKNLELEDQYQKLQQETELLKADLRHRRNNDELEKIKVDLETERKIKRDLKAEFELAKTTTSTNLDKLEKENASLLLKLDEMEKLINQKGIMLEKLTQESDQQLKLISVQRIELEKVVKFEKEISHLEKLVNSEKEDKNLKLNSIEQLEKRIVKLVQEKQNLLEEKNQILDKLKSDESVSQVLEQIRKEKDELQAIIDRFDEEKRHLNELVNKLNIDCEKEKNRTNSLQTEKDQLEQNLKQLNQQKVDLQSEFTVKEKHFTEKLKSLEKLAQDEKIQFDSKFEDLNKKHQLEVQAVQTNFEKDIAIITDQCNELKSERKTLQDQKDLQRTVDELKDECLRLQEHLKSNVEHSKQETHELNTLVSDLEQKIDDIRLERDNSENREKQAQKWVEDTMKKLDEMKKLENEQKHQLAALTFDITAKENSIAELNSKILNIEHSLQLANLENEKLQQCRIDIEERFCKEIEHLKSQIVKLEEQLKSQENLRQIDLKTLEKVQQENDKSKTEIDNLKSGLSTLQSEKCNFTTVIDDLKKEKSSLQSTLDLLKKEKDSLQECCKEINSRANNLDKELQKTLNDFKLFQMASFSSKEELESSTQDCKQNLTLLQNEMEGLKKSHQDEISIVNLDSIKFRNLYEKVDQEFSGCKLDLESSKKELRHAVQIKKDLEAQLNAWSDEKRALLEKCLNLEKYLDEEKDNERELNRRLDDALSALHDLGREHQSMQIDISRHFNRKWADDSNVLDCMGCKKNFTLTIRKHHCRHCGLIFCNDCSNKTFLVPAAKKPVRVCENCFKELSVH